MAGLRIDTGELAYGDVTVCAEARVDAFLGSSTAPGQGSERSIETRAKRLRGNIRGRAGEVAVLRFLADELPAEWAVIDVADRSGSPGDIQVHAEGPAPAAIASIEVKTTTYRQWRDRGRVIERSQLERDDTTIYVWCVTAETSLRDDVHILGWSFSDRVRACANPVPVRVPVPRPRLRIGGWHSGAVPQFPSASSSYDYDHDDVGLDEYEGGIEEYQVDSPGETNTRVAPDNWDHDWLGPAQEADRQLQLSLVHSAHPWPEGSGPMWMVSSEEVSDLVRTTAEVEPPEALVDAIVRWSRDRSGAV